MLTRDKLMKALKQGISEEEAYAGWVERKQKKLRSDFKSSPPMVPTAGTPVDITAGTPVDMTTLQLDDVPLDPTPTKKATRSRSTVILLIASPFIAFAAMFVMFVISEATSSSKHYKLPPSGSGTSPAISTPQQTPPKLIELPAELGGRARVIQNPHFRKSQ
jgi:hypothetical protein